MLLTYWPSEFSQIRGQYRHTSLRRRRHGERSAVPVPVFHRRARRARVLERSIMKKFSTLAAAIAAVVCSAPLPARAALKVVATTQDLESLGAGSRRRQGRSRVARQGLPGSAPSKPKPSFILKLNKADLLIVVGRELEIGWLPRADQPGAQPEDPARAPTAISTRRSSAHILEMPTGQITRAMGDVHPQGNPHYWLDPENGRRIAKAIQQEALGRSARPTRPTSRSATPISNAAWPRRRSAGTPRWPLTRAPRSSPITARGRTSSTPSASTSSATSSPSPAFRRRRRTPSSSASEMKKRQT